MGCLRDQQAQSLGLTGILRALFWPAVCFSSLSLSLVFFTLYGKPLLSRMHPCSLFLKHLQYSLKAAGEKGGFQNRVYGENPSLGNLFHRLCPH